jgi:hypothetical protein
VSFVLRSLVVCCAAALLLVPAAPAGSNVAPRLGIYYCSYGLSGWNLQLRTGGKYVQGYADAKNTRIKGVIGSGIYRITGPRVTFRSGSLKSFYGVAKTARKFNLALIGQRTASYTCDLSR